ncbi:MAG: undecaprenyl-diphosphate phosphatase, partial [Candidatus Korarchaeum sp.]
MDLWEALLLGAIQGLTEWLPISSSAHLVILQELLSCRSVLLDAVVHGGTLLSVLLTSRADVIRVLKGFFRSLAEVRASESPDLPHESK